MLEDRRQGWGVVAVPLLLSLDGHGGGDDGGAPGQTSGDGGN